MHIKPHTLSEMPAKFGLHVMSVLPMANIYKTCLSKYVGGKKKLILHMWKSDCTPRAGKCAAFKTIKFLSEQQQSGI